MSRNMLTGFASGHGGAARWGMVVGTCQSCGRPVRERTVGLVDGLIVHRADLGTVVPANAYEEERCRQIRARGATSP